MRADAIKVMKEQQKKYGKKVIFMASDIPPLRRIPSGSLMLDAAIGGGFPCGRLIELYGWKDSTKTSLLLITMGLAQKRGEACYLSHPEKNIDWPFAKLLGVDAKELGLAYPKTGEEGMMQVIEAVESGAFQVVGLDSITAFVSSQVINKGMERTIGVEAYFNNLFTKRCILANQDCAFIIVNQPRTKIGGPFQLPPEPGGGSALKHYKSVSIELGKGPWLGADGVELAFGTRKEKVGFTVRFKIRKNKVFSPYKEGSYRFYFKKWKDGGVGIDAAWDILRLRRMHGIKKAAKISKVALQKKGWPEGY